DIVRQNVRGSRARTDQPTEETQEGRRPRAVRHAEAGRSLRNRNAQVVDGANLAEHLRQPGGLNEYRRSRPVSSRPSSAPMRPMAVLGFVSFGVSNKSGRGQPPPPRPRPGATNR